MARRCPGRAISRASVGKVGGFGSEHGLARERLVRDAVWTKVHFDEVD